MLDGIFGEQEKLELEPLSQEAKAAIDDARLILQLREDREKLGRFELFVQFAQEDKARARNISDPEHLEVLKNSTRKRFELMDLSEETSKDLTQKIYGR